MDAARAGVVDREAALRRLVGNEQLLATVARRFPVAAARSVEALRSSVAHGDWPAAKFASHRLRGQAAIFDAEALVEATLALDAAIDGGRSAESAPIVERIATLADEVCAALATWVHEGN